MAKEKIDFQSLQGLAIAGIETLQALITDLCGDDSDVQLINYGSHYREWVVSFYHSEDLTFDTFQELYEWITTEGRE